MSSAGKAGERSLSGTFMPQLDGLRAIACAMVMFSHFAPQDWWPRQALPWGAVGVHLFFVLSGFLITGILLESRARLESGAPARWQFRQFYARRFLRIFPLYYAVLLILFVADYGLMRDTILIHLLYLQNIWRCVEGVQFANHLWSLAVEEQFYLFWPCLVLFLPRSLLPWSMALLVPGALLFRLVLWWFGASFLYLNIFPLSNLDALGAGSLLAFAWRNEAWLNHFKRARLPLLGVGVFLTLVVLGQRYQWPDDIRTPLVLFGAAVTLLFVPLVDAAAQGMTGLPGAFLNLALVRYLGKISYGLYVIHPFTMHSFDAANPWAMEHPLIRAAVLSTISIALAALSWHLFESPINALKHRFPYHRNP